MTGAFCVMVLVVAPIAVIAVTIMVLVNWAYDRWGF
jgi:hypothetical protein